MSGNFQVSPLESSNFPLPQLRAKIALFRFGPYEVDLSSGQLRKFGYRVKLQPKSFLVLETLLESDGELVTREELKTRLWPENTFVEFESSLNVAVRRLREALNDDAQSPTYIETIPRRGYRFIGKAERIQAPAPAPQLVPAPGQDCGSVPATEAPVEQSWGRRNRSRLVFSAVLVLLIAGLLVWRRATRSATAIPSSIAVLPFADLSPEKNQSYFSEGLAEELLNELAKTPGLRVAARTSSFQFHDKAADPVVVGKKLGVATILEGSVRKDGNRVRISAELVKATDGFQLWSGTYDRHLNDVFAVQDEIARAITSELKLKLLKPAPPALTQRTMNVEGYNAYLQGRYFYERRTQDDLDKAYACFQQAVKADPGYAQAWSALAWVLIARAEGAYGPSFSQGYESARAAAEKALQLDPGLAEAHAAIGRIERSYDWDWAAADVAFRKALAIAPQSSVVLLGASSLDATLGRFDDAVVLNRRVVEIDPLSVAAHVSMGMHAYYAGQLSLAADAYQKALAISPDDPEAHYLLGLVYLSRSQPQQALTEFQKDQRGSQRGVGEALAYAALGRKLEADAALQQLIINYREQAAYQIAEVYAFRGEPDKAFQWLEIARLHRDAGIPSIKGDPLLKNLYGDARFAALLSKLGLQA